MINFFNSFSRLGEQAKILPELKLKWPDGKVIVNNTYCNLIGRVTMDQILYDVTDVEVNINDEVVLLGNSENNELKITVFDIAKCQ